MSQTTVDAENLKHFTAHAEKWWDPDGPFKPLHHLNPTRLEFLRREMVKHFDLDVMALTPLENLKVLDIGCGGGLICEPLTRLGALVTGIDAGQENIHAAKTHAQESGLSINYLSTTAEDLLESRTSQAAESKGFDVVLALEVVEHVQNVDAFLKCCLGHLKPGGLIILSTLNRTLKSYGLGIVAAEYILRWVPRGTHSWMKFFKPSELGFKLEEQGCTLKTIQGMSFNVLGRSWGLSRDVDVNYFITATLSETQLKPGP